MHWLQGSSFHTDIPKAVEAAAEDDHGLTREEITAIRALFEQHQESFDKMTRKFHNVVNSRPQTPVQNVDSKNAAADTEKINVSKSASESNSGNNAHVSNQDEKQQNLTLEEKSFFSRLIAKIKTIIEKVAELTGKTVVTFSAVLTAPISFGADLVTGTIYGHGLISENEDEAKYQISGGLAGVESMRLLTTNMSTSIVGPISVLNSVGILAIATNAYICRNSDPRESSEFDLYCKDTNQISSSITISTAHVGAAIGTTIHGIFTHKSADNLIDAN